MPVSSLRLLSILVINQVSVTPSCIQYFARRFTELRGKFLCLLVYYIMKDADEQPDEQVHEVRSGRVQVQELLSLCSWDILPSKHLDLFTNPEAL